jgi:glucose-6-phosphate isomerase
MLSGNIEKVYPSAKALVRQHVASRLHAKDASLYNFSKEAEERAAQYMGWTDLASNPPTAPEEIEEFASQVVAAGLENVLLLGQGGSTQAPMTITKYNSVDAKTDVRFRTLDSDSPVRLRSILAGVDPKKLLVITASKSGSTMEPMSYLRAVRAELAKTMPEDEVVRHLVAITDPGSPLEKQAREEGWLKVFLGEPSVGGRYSALSVFGLVPAALVGINMNRYMANAREAEARCAEDSIDNPAIILAAFLYDNYRAGRDKFSFLTQKRGRVLGLWIEQLVAESLGKNGKGILPNIESDALVLSKDAGDRTAIMYKTRNSLWDEVKNFEMGLGYVAPTIPQLNFRVDDACGLPEDFLVWEYATAMVGYLMHVCPFDQPDVASAKQETLKVLAEGTPEPDFTVERLGTMPVGNVEVRLGQAMKGATTLQEALRSLMRSVKPGDYFALDAFLPFTGEGRREALEMIRHTFAHELGVVSCLEIGPRYLHSTGQMQKGGPDTGVYLIISADEMKDVPLPDWKAPSLAALAKAQACGDLEVLSERGRRVVHVHLPDNSGSTLRVLAELVEAEAREIMRDEHRDEQGRA